MASTSRPSTFDGLSALVTGGSRGLGLLLSARLAQRGCRVTVAARDADELGRGADWIKERTGTTVSTVVCDVRDRDAVESAVRRTDSRQGGLDIVIANAGVIQVAPVASLDSGAFDDAMATIFGGAVNTAMAALPHLQRSEAGGRLCLIGSVGGLLAVPHLLPYSCAKAAVGTLGEGLRAETVGTNVSVTTVHPGLMRTGSHLQAEFGGRSAKEFAWFSALSGTPVVSMDADRAAERIVRALQRRRTRLVLTPAAHAAGVAHGVAPTAVTRLSGFATRFLPRSPTGEGADGTPRDRIVQGHRIDSPLSAWAEKVRSLGSRLNDRAVRRYNQEIPGPPTSA
ncbi:NAD(P)-dependent dehydrogenase (short-subunit alcohol dehydrogenase family) [Streptomyces sp. V3I8]|uniref:SDR family NAD(P)-dependent oxidoreductase n=1 Tax=Streptomyces sp. V3I8 TaxID=3042279 RepID=UPI00277D6B3C|nr:SDR family oxidoreductase [Streptomyces sp. V3I8]MDQ1041348.1 NAD(P)-dependent dehydrogenase (short-subunit alcohol dehydrogenase family) [Streptomyces sp. V3I8]